MSLTCWSLCKSRHALPARSWNCELETLRDRIAASSSMVPCKRSCSMPRWILPCSSSHTVPEGRTVGTTCHGFEIDKLQHNTKERTPEPNWQTWSQIYHLLNYPSRQVIVHCQSHSQSSLVSNILSISDQTRIGIYIHPILNPNPNKNNQNRASFVLVGVRFAEWYKSANRKGSNPFSRRRWFVS